MSAMEGQFHQRQRLTYQRKEQPSPRSDFEESPLSVPCSTCLFHQAQQEDPAGRTWRKQKSSQSAGLRMTPTLRESPPATFQLTSSPAHFLENIHPGEEPKGMLVSSLVAPGQSLARLLAGNPQGRVTSAGAQRPDRSLKKAEWSGVAFLAPFLLFAYAVCQLKSLCPYFDSASLRRWGSQKKRGQTPVMYATQACEVRGEGIYAIHIILILAREAVKNPEFVLARTWRRNGLYNHINVDSRGQFSHDGHPDTSWGQYGRGPPPDRLITCCTESLASEILSLNLNHTSIHLSEEIWRTMELCFNMSQRKQSAFDLLLEQQSVNDQGVGALFLLGCPSDSISLAECKDQLRRLAGNFVADLIIGSVQGEKTKISKFCESRFIILEMILLIVVLSLLDLTGWLVSFACEELGKSPAITPATVPETFREKENWNFHVDCRDQDGII
ncbi:hypothetical protein I7I51_03904 [Histoplasma capsulatum]|uniref:Uncharacterized protein n=1 Tax=Ajellomyces capsulatus TaxID=5037 RepID=A0A8A1MC58_AJECA|nr:hypothetical protein I7I51_03904 [Histoplasma capsulatum]